MEAVALLVVAVAAMIFLLRLHGPVTMPVPVPVGKLFAEAGP